MRKFCCLFLSVLLLFALCLPVSAETSATTANPLRAVWLRPTEKDDASVETAVQKLAESGINAVFLESVFNGYTIFPTEYESTCQNPDFDGFDVLKSYVEACHRHKMQIHAWVESFFVGMEWVNAGGPVVAAHPEWLIADQNGNTWEDTVYGKMYFINPVNPECRNWLVGLYSEMCEAYDLDGIQLDYVRYPEKTAEKDYGYDEYTLNAFMEARGLNPVGTADGSDVARAFCQFKQAGVTAYVQACSEACKAAHPGLAVSFSVSPYLSYGESNYMQTAAKWMQKGYGEYLFPMCYGENQLEELLPSLLSAVSGNAAKLVIGLSCQSEYTTESIRQQAASVLEKGCGVAFFEYQSFFSGRYAEALKTDTLADTLFFSEASEAEESEISAPNPFPPYSHYVFIAAAALLVGCLLFLILRKKPTTEEAETPPENAEDQ